MQLAVQVVSAETAFQKQFQEREEIQLIQAVDNFQAGDINTALSTLEQLVQSRPYFQLAQLTYAEALATLGQIAPLPGPQKNSRLTLLHEEAQKRYQARQVPTREKIPASIISLNKKHPYALIVDLTLARLYLIDNRQPLPSIIGDHYITLGKAGFGKARINDNKTPLGVYTIHAFMDGNRLPDLYGKGAFPINYPNAWDKYNQKTGYGIWLHGNPSQKYSRPPRDSRGCITISNDSFEKLKRFITIGETPLILTEKINWLPQQDWILRQQNIKNILSTWKNDWESLNVDLHLQHYSTNYRRQTQGYAFWEQYKRHIAEVKTYIQVDISELDIFLYPGERNLFMTRFVQHYQSNNYPKEGARLSHKQLYWQLEQDGKWRIVHEVES
ncbi:MAG TPA: hypothetical protein DCZ12_14905 [Gammaproteobacteria bacterium]|nr:hypothetical protein [Gammaproteobacteria bacterium]